MHVQHKSHVGKEIYIVVIDFVLNNSDTIKGGRAIPVGCIRVSKMVKAIKYSYRPVYESDVKFCYPKIAENILSKNKEGYFQEVELTGSIKGTKKKPMM